MQLRKIWPVSLWLIMSMNRITIRKNPVCYTATFKSQFTSLNDAIVTKLWHKLKKGLRNIMNLKLTVSKRLQRYESFWFAICSSKSFQYNNIKHYFDGNISPNLQICPSKQKGVRIVKSYFYTLLCYWRKGYNVSQIALKTHYIRN